MRASAVAFSAPTVVPVLLVVGESLLHFDVREREMRDE
jgi:hypothetical protein